jgi:hypothetical protein
MNSRLAPPAVGAPARAAAPPDAFALASAKLNAQRPVRDARLLQIVTVLQSNLLQMADAQLADYLTKRLPRKRSRCSPVAWRRRRILPPRAST